VVSRSAMLAYSCDEVSVGVWIGVCVEACVLVSSYNNNTISMMLACDTVWAWAWVRVSDMALVWDTVAVYDK